jgi:hypothetical protein
MRVPRLRLPPAGLLLRRCGAALRDSGAVNRRRDGWRQGAGTGLRRKRVLATVKYTGNTRARPERQSYLLHKPDDLVSHDQKGNDELLHTSGAANDTSVYL